MNQIPLLPMPQHRKRPLEKDADETEGDTRRIRSREKEDVEIYFTELLKDDVTEKDMVEFLWKHYHDSTYNYERQPQLLTPRIMTNTPPQQPATFKSLYLPKLNYGCSRCTFRAAKQVLVKKHIHLCMDHSMYNDMCIWAGQGMPPRSFHEEGGDLPVIADPRFRDKIQGVRSVFSRASQTEFFNFVEENKEAMRKMEAIQALGRKEGGE
ncbi:hypothetical protein DFH27DRAFT_524280 [Peziza echinospora]|nr:hypothetical protein DFH27DRAFT_524280 [Peziza echinospora]